MISQLTGTAAQWGLLASFIVAACTTLGIWLKSRPDQTRADNEAKAQETDEQAVIRTYNIEQIKGWRREVHEVNERLHAVLLEQDRSNRAITEATSVIRGYENDRRAMMLLIKLMVADMRKKDPSNPLIAHSELVLSHLSDAHDPNKSDALNNAETAVADAKQTVLSATATFDEVKSAEGKQ